jgi:hypothetical protein
MILINEFKLRADANGIPVFTMAIYIHENNVKYPFRQVSEQKFVEMFRKFASASHVSWLKHPETVVEKFDYKYKYADMPLGVIEKSHYYNIVADRFQQENRMNCGSASVDAPLTIWNDLEKLKKMNWHFWRDGALEKSNIAPTTFRSAFRLGTYVATQFKPSVAKFIYEYHNAINVLDTSCGWGDRLAGFYATPSTELYVGCDPNPAVYETYKKQCLAYELALSNEKPMFQEYDDHFVCSGIKRVIIWNLPAEDVAWTQYPDTFDMYFTSPPYFDTEKYGVGTGAEGNQSWNRYDQFELWRDEFFFKVSRMVWDTIKKDGFMMINIIEPSGKKGRHALCDDMVDTMKSFPDSYYVGKLGMRMMARPNSPDVKACLIEPIWTFRKGNSEYSAPQGLENFY